MESVDGGEARVGAIPAGLRSAGLGAALGRLREAGAGALHAAGRELAAGPARTWWLAAGACLAWPLAGPAVWASITGALPPPVLFFALAAAIWGAGWIGVLWARAATADAASAGPALALERGPLALGLGGALGLLWAGLRWATSLFAWSVGLHAAAAAVAFLTAAALLLAALGVLGRLARGRAVALPAGRRLRGGDLWRAAGRLTFGGLPRGRLGAAAVLAAAAAPLLWWLLRLYLPFFAPDPFVRAWVGWGLLTLATAAGLAGLAWIASDEPAAGPDGPASGAGRAGEAAAAAGAVATEPAAGGPPAEGANTDEGSPAPAAATATGAGGAPTGSGGPKGAAWAVCAGVYVALLVAFGLIQPGLALAPAAAATRTDLRSASWLQGHGAWPAAERSARRAVAAAAGEAALRALDRAGGAQAAAALASAAVRIDPASVAGRQAQGLLALARHTGAGAVAAATALVEAGARGAGGQLASLACAAGTATAAAQRAAARACEAAGAADALWWSPALAVEGVPPVSAKVDGAPPPHPVTDAALGAAVSLWSHAAGEPELHGATAAQAAQVMADGYLLLQYLRGVPEMPAGAEQGLGLDLMMAGADMSDRGAIADGARLIDVSRPLAAPLAELVLDVGSTFGEVAPEIAGGAQASPLPPPVAKAALAAAAAAGAPDGLLRSAGVYSLLTANNTAGTAVTGERAAIGFLTRYLARRPKDAAAWDDLALANYELAAYPAAIAAGGRSLALGPDPAAEIVVGQSHLGLAMAENNRAAAKAGDLTAAVADLRRGLQQDPAPFLPWMALGNALQLQKQWQQALTAYQQALKYYQYDLSQHVDSFSAPHEGWAFTGMPGRGAGKARLAGLIRQVQGELKAHGG